MELERIDYIVFEIGALAITAWSAVLSLLF
jgi:hypothetical protein